MNIKKNQRNIHLMYAIAFFQGIVLYASISALYRQARGLSLAEYALIEGFSYLFQLAFEIPFGIIADRIGYKKTLVISNGFYLISKITFWQAFGFRSFLLERLFLSMAVAGLSGVDSSILYLSCNKRESQTVFSRYGAAGTAGMLTGSLIFALFLSHNYEATALGTVIAYGIAFVLSFFVLDVSNVEGKEERQSLCRINEILKITLKDWKFLLFLLGEAMISYSTWAVSVMLNQNKYISLGLTEQHIGWVEIAFSVFALLGAYSAALTKKMGFRKFMVTGVGICAISALVMGFTGSIVVALASCALLEIAYCLLQPLISDLFSKRVSVSDRATQLSIYAMVTECITFGISFIMSLISASSYEGSFVFCAALAVLGIFLFLYCYRGIPSTDI